MPARAKVKRRKRKARDPLSIIPCSNAKNAYDLLEDVKRVIKEDPKRYNQEQWLSSCNTKFLDRIHPNVLDTDVDTIEDWKEEYLRDRNRMPACGTMACVAGWVYTMKAKEGEDLEPAYFAGKILGLQSGTSKHGREYSDLMSELFNGGAAGLYDDLTPEEHAQRGIDHITRFQEKYKDRLKATPVE